MSQRDQRLIGDVYHIGQIISESPMLMTATAHNRNTNEIVGLLLLNLPPQLEYSEITRLLEKLEPRRQVVSPHLLKIHDWGIEDQRIFIVTDPPRGTSLRYVLDTEDVSLTRSLDVVSQVLQGLVSLEAAQIFAVDLRPTLITIDEVSMVDRVQIDDLGLQAILNEIGYLETRDRASLAYRDPRYASPEYIDGSSVGPSSAVYQVGLLLFELVTGRQPFVGKDDAETGVMQRFRTAPLLKTYKHDVPPAWQAVLQQALAKDPSARYPDAAAFLAALDALRVEQTIPLETVKTIIDSNTLLIPSPVSGSGTDFTREITVITEHVPVTPQGTHVDMNLRREDPIFIAPVEEGVYAYLYVVDAPEDQPPLALKQKSVVLGRLDPKRKISPDLDLAPFDPRMTISRQHARIRIEDSLFYLEDLKSRNKTRLGSLTLQPFTPVLLQHGDIVRLGSVHLIFRLPGVRDLPKFSKEI